MQTIVGGNLATACLLTVLILGQTIRGSTLLPPEDLAREDIQFFPVVKFLGSRLPPGAVVDSGLFVRAGPACAGAPPRRYRDPEALLALAEGRASAPCPIGTEGKKLAFKGRIPIDFNRLLREGIGGPPVDTAGKTLIYKGIVPVQIHT